MAAVGNLSTDSDATLKTEIKIVATLGLVALLVFFVGLGLTWHWQVANLWLGQALLLGCLVLWQAWRLRDMNRTHVDAPLLADLGWGNRLTLLRGMLIAMTGGFLNLPPSVGVLVWLPGILYCLAAILDRVDGFVARRTQRTTLLGERLDTLLDALGLVIAPLVAVDQGKLHWSFLLVSAAYYLFQAGLYWRRRHGKPVFPLMPSQLRRTLAGFQMGFVGAVLLLPLQPPMTVLLGFAFMLPLLLGFCVDWFVVSGRLNGSSPMVSRFFQWLNEISSTILLPILRLVLFTFVWMLLVQDATLSVVTGVLAAACVLVLLGLTGRVGALTVLLLLSVRAGSGEFDGIVVTAALAAVVILLLGAGRFSLWRGDDLWVNRHDGA